MKKKKIIKLLSNNKYGIMIVLLLLSVGFSAYTALGRTAGQISDPVGSWPSDDKGYIGYPTDLTVGDSASLLGNETIYNAIGKIWNKVNNSGSGRPCGDCVVHGNGATATGCCGTYYSYICVAPSNGTMFRVGGSFGYGVNNYYAGTTMINYQERTTYYMCYE